MQVVWAEQQYERKRLKRDFASQPSPLRQAITSFALGKGSEFPDPFYREQWYLVRPILITFFKRLNTTKDKDKQTHI